MGLVDVTLVRFKSSGEQRDFRIKNGRCLVGRQDSADLPIPVSSVSREHCVFQVEGERATLKDLGSRNGTYRNGERIEGEVELEAGDQVAIGPIIFTVQINGEPEYVEPPLLEAPTASTAQSSNAAGASEDDDAAKDDSAAGLSDLIADLEGDDSSVFDLDMYLEEDDDEK